MSKDLNEMMSQTETDTSQISIKKDNKIKYIILIILLVTALIGAGLFAVIQLNRRGDGPDFGPQIGQDVVITQTEQQEPEPDVPTWPFIGPEWSMTYYSWSSQEEGFRDDVIEWAQETGFFDDLIFLPSIANGFTNDPDEAITEDYYFNPNFSSVLLEDVMFNTSVYLHKLINPLFGEWQNLQDINPDVHASFFMPNGNAIDNQNAPMITRFTHEELNANAWEDFLRVSYMGEILSIEFAGTESVNFVDGVNVTSRIRFHAVDQEPIYGTITFTYTTMVSESDHVDYSFRMQDIELTLE